jgi:DNA end-binding protein Ku
MSTRKQPASRTRRRAGRTPRDAAAGDAAGAKPIWSGTLSFGLVAVPVNLFPAVRSVDAPLRMLAPSGEPVQRHYVCPADGKDAPWEQIVRGYEVAEGEYVPLTDAELEAIAPRKSRDIDLRRFVPRAELDPFLFERPYVLTPAGESTKPYRLLAEAMAKSDRAGIATFVMRTKEYLVAIVAERGILFAETLRFAGELRTPKDVGLPTTKAPDAKDVDGFARVLRKLARDEVAADELVPPRRDRLLALAQKKLRAGEDVVEPKAPAAADGAEAPADPSASPDLFASIRASLKLLQGGAARKGDGDSDSDAAPARAGAKAKARATGKRDGGAVNAPAQRRASPRSRTGASRRSPTKRRPASRARPARSAR